jgi:hypothetical protein
LTPTENLVDRIVRLALDQDSPEIRTLVVHNWPDTDAWLCLWVAKKFVRKAEGAEIVFVRSGEILAGSEDDPSVLHFDTGGGKYDQHGKSLPRTSSAVLLAQGLEIHDNPGLKALLELTVMVDNVEEIAPTNIHYIIEGLPRIHLNTDNEPDWTTVQKTVFDMFDIVYGQEASRQKSRDDLEKLAGFYTLPNGLRFTELLGCPRLREAAFERGADVVLWTERKKNGFYVGVQVNRRSGVLLSSIAVNLRRAEAAKRGLTLEDDFTFVGQKGTNWFLHDSLKLILCGSRTHELTGDEFTKLTVQQICQVVGETLEKIPEQVVKGRR